MKSISRIIQVSVSIIAVVSLFAFSVLLFNSSKQSNTSQATAAPSPLPQSSVTPTPIPYPLPSTPAPTIIVPTARPLNPTPMPPEVTDALESPRQITTRPMLRRNLTVAGNYVAWTIYEGNESSVVIYDLTKNTEQKIGTLVSDGKSDLKIYGQYIIWTEDINLPDKITTIYVYNLATDRKTEIKSPAYAQGYPDISSGIIVWNDSRNATGKKTVGDIYGFDLSKGEEFPVVVGAGEQLFPRIDGGWVIYLNWLPTQSPKTDQPTLRAQNIHSGENIELGPANYSDRNIDSLKWHTIFSNTVVWKRTDGFGVYIYDLALRQMRRSDQPDTYNRLYLYGNVLSTGSVLFNVNTGARQNSFYFFPDRPSQVDEVVTDGQTMVWSYGGKEGRIYVARLRRQP